MINKLGMSVLSKFGATNLPPANQRVEQIENKINTINGVQAQNTSDVKSFSSMMPNTSDNEPVRLLRPKVMISLIQEKAKKYNIDPKLVNAVIKAESGYNINAKSQAGAVGLMQLMPATARAMGIGDPTDPAQNVEAGTKYLSQLLQKNNGNIVLALASYNAGPGNVSSYGGVPPYKETKDYIYKVLQTYIGTSQRTQEITNV